MKLGVSDNADKILLIITEVNLKPFFICNYTISNYLQHAVREAAAVVAAAKNTENICCHSFFYLSLKQPHFYH